MPTHRFSYTRHADAKIRCALEIKRYISQKNVRLLKAFLQKFTAVNVNFLYYLNETHGLLLLAAEYAEQARDHAILDGDDEQRILMMFIAYGFKDTRVYQKYARFKRAERQEGWLIAIVEEFKTFRDLKSLNHYYRTFVAPQLVFFSDLDSIEIETRYTHTQKHLSLLHDKHYALYLDDFIKNRSISSDKQSFLLPYLSECSCLFFDRRRNSRRRELGDKIVNETTSRLSQDDRLVYLSLGLGGGLQDFELLYRLIQHDYFSMKVVLIDPKLEVDVMRQMKELCVVAANHQVQFEMLFYESIDAYEVSEAFESPNLICSIDFSNIFAFSGFADLMKAHALMASHGYFYLSFGKYDIVFDANRCLDYSVYHGKDELPPVNADLFMLQGRARLSYASLGQKESLWEWLLLSKALHPSSCCELSLTLIKPRRINTRGYLTNRVHEELDETHLTYFFKLLFPLLRDNFTLTLVDSVPAFVRYQREHLRDFDVVTLVDFEVNQREAERLQCWFKHISFRTSYVYRLIVDTVRGTHIIESENYASLDPLLTLPTPF